ncbi:Transcriptional regulator, contains XRE-family HTH domain [Flexibacter flexilis DSM 6793]|uniref:Transcriptional regulator, contains XRE-family HTH domain n=1 Tax=Flexibacter flexilis DSM 6793 TaxID=927664 RepID=A0A1I1M1U4_9BACT|nr:type II toxin-antitoxin system antitoxin SocA domain-containing protein [Flexibacter flexilis]SFC75630.1 Transcriptional regulator, contains XRE-family HTH domain [Flexibacter flexilis DSM 6793]
MITNTLSQEQIGLRIVAIRKQKELSQEQLSKLLDISRPSLAQIELGNRSISALELQRLALVLHFSLDDFMSESFSVDKLQRDNSIAHATAQEAIRISVPELQIQKLKNVLLYVLEYCAGKPNVGETVLYKLLYFSDFNYYELYEEHLTGSKYRKLPFGPVPYSLDKVINEMLESQQIQRIKTHYHGYTQTRYIPLEKADLLQLKASETAVMDYVLKQMADWSAKAISEYSHGDLPWQATDEGKEIDYELAFYREQPYSVRVYDENEE